MRRIASHLTICLTLFALTTLAALLIGRAQPTPPRVGMLHLTDCELPCWIGIVPGKTTVGEAKKLIHQIYNPAFYSTSNNIGGNVQIYDRTSKEFTGLSVLLNYPNTIDSDTVHLVILKPFSSLKVVYGELEDVWTPPLSTIIAVNGTNQLFLSTLKTLPNAWLILEGRPTSNVTCIGVSPKNPVLALGISSESSRNTQFAPWRGLRSCYP